MPKRNDDDDADDGDVNDGRNDNCTINYDSTEHILSNQNQVQINRMEFLRRCTYNIPTWYNLGLITAPSSHRVLQISKH